MALKISMFLLAFGLALSSASGDSTNPGDSKDPRNQETRSKEKTNIEEINPTVLKILRTTNQAQVQRYVPRVYVFNHANPHLAIRFMRRFVQVEEGHIDTFVHPDGNSGRVLVVIPEYQVPYVDELMAKLDRPGLTSSSGRAFEFVQLKHRSTLTDLDGNGRADIADAAYQVVSSDTDMLPDAETNGAVVLGPPSGVNAALEFCKGYDVPTPEVSIELRVYEIDADNDRALGLDYLAWKNGPGRALFSFGAFAESEKIDYGSGVGNGQQFDSGAGTMGLPHRRMGNHGTNASYYVNVPSAFFDFLTVKGTAKILTSGKVSSMSGLPAVFRSVEKIPFLRIDPAAPSSSGATYPANILPVPPGQAFLGTGPANINDRRLEGDTAPRQTQDVTISGFDRITNEEFKESGLVLWVTPTISLENVDLDVLTSVADLQGFDDRGNPLLATRVVSTDVRARSGEEVVLGGIQRTQSVETTRKMPFLGSIPVVGYLFGGDITSRKVTNVVEVVCPTIIENQASPEAEYEEIVSQVAERVPAPLPADEYGFDQYILDPAK